MKKVHAPRAKPSRLTKFNEWIVALLSANGAQHTVPRFDMEGSGASPIDQPKRFGYAFPGSILNFHRTGFTVHAVTGSSAELIDYHLLNLPAHEAAQKKMALPVIRCLAGVVGLLHEGRDWERAFELSFVIDCIGQVQPMMSHLRYVSAIMVASGSTLKEVAEHFGTSPERIKFEIMAAAYQLTDIGAKPDEPNGGTHS